MNRQVRKNRDASKPAATGRAAGFMARGRVTEAAAVGPRAEPLESRALLSAVDFAVSSYSAVNYVESTVTGDFNRDGKTDVVTIGYSIRLFAGRGDGTFHAGVAVGDAPADLCRTADLNGDGNLDLYGPVEGYVAGIAYGAGDGTFAPPVRIGTTQTTVYTHDAVAADVNGDGRLDLLTANESAGTVGVYVQTATGSFAAAGAVTTGGQPYALAAGDFDGDGRADAAVANVTSGVTLLLGNGNATFRQSSLPAGGGQTAITAGDLNADGRPDLVFTRLGGGPSVLRNIGGGAFATAVPYSVPGGNAFHVGIGNFRNDGKPDIVATQSSGTEGGWVLTGRGDGTFDVADAPVMGPGVGRFALGDFNGDGLTDLATGSNNYLFVQLSRPVVTTGGRFGTRQLTDVTVATVTDNLMPDAPGAPTAVINWGDGRSSPGTVVPAAGGTYRVVGSHTFPYNKYYEYAVTVTLPGGRAVTVTGANDVRDAPPEPTFHPIYAGGKNWPDRLAAGPDGDLWFGHNPDLQTAAHTPRPSNIGRLNPATGAVMLYPIPGGGPTVRPLASDAAGNAWFVVDAGRLGRLDASGTVTQFATPVAPVQTLVRGPDGDVWFPVAAAAGGGIDRLARVATTGPSTGTVTVVPLDRTTATISNMAVGPDGNFWAAQSGAGKVTRITPAGAVTEFPVIGPYSHKEPAHVAAGPDGNVWFTMQSAGVIGRVTPAGAMTLFEGAADPVAITTGPDGSLWYLGYQIGGGRVGRITPDGAHSWYRFPPRYNGYPGYFRTGSYPTDIIAGSDGNLWITEQATNAVTRFSLAEAPLLAPAPPTGVRKGVPFSGEVARFTDATLGTPEDYDVAISWGDGTTTPGTLVPITGGYAVHGSHTYATEANFTMVVTVTPWGDVPVATTAPVVVDYPLEAVRAWAFHGTEGRTSPTTTLLTFRDTDPDGTYGPFTATIDWGDGTTSTGTVSPGSAAGLLNATGSHAYAREGQYTVTVTVRDAGATLTASTTARVAKSVVTQPPVAYDATAAGRVAVGDFNGDGKPDVASAGPGGGRIDVLAGIGGGALAQARAAATVGGAGVRALVAADFNRDGRADVAAAVPASPGTAAHVEVYLGNPDGTFTAAGRFDAPAGALAAADLNGDGNPDLVAGGPDAAGLVVALGNGGGGFAAAAVTLAGAAPSIAVADFDGDGKPDVAAGVAGSTAARLLRGVGNGTFAPPVEYAGSATTGTAHVAAGDIDGDGRPDLAVADAVSNTLSVLPNAGDGTFAAAVVRRLDESVAATAAAGAVGGLTAADVNGDGVADLLRASNDPGAARVNVRLGKGPNAFDPTHPDARFALGLPTVPADPATVTAADLNGDGRADLVASGGGKVFVLMNTPYALAAPANLTAAEGQAFAGKVIGILTHEDPPAVAAGLAATVDWGDGTSSAATLVANATTGGLDVVGGHTYRRAGTYTTRVTVTDAAGLRTTAAGSVKVSNAAVAVTGRTFAATTNAAATAVVASFADGNPFGELTDFAAQIDWGNGRVTPGIVRADPAAGPGRYTVTGTQTYAAAGSFTVKVTVTDAAATATPATGTGTATVTTPVPGTGTISGTIHNDLNFNGARDAGEPPLFAWTAYVDANNNGALDAGERSALTSSAGQFTIADVPAGTWTVRQAVESAWRQTAPADEAAGRAVAVAPGQAATGVAFLSTRRPAAVMDAGPAFRAAAVDQVAVTFSEPVSGFDLSDLTLTRDGVPVPLAPTGGGGGAGGALTGAAPTLVTTDNVRFTLRDLAGVTAAPGAYALTLAGPPSGITAAGGHVLAVGVTSGFTVLPTPAIVSWASAGPDGTAEAALTVPDDGTFMDPRSGGIRTLRIAFAGPIDPASFTPAGVAITGIRPDGTPVALDGISVSTTTLVGDTVGIITFGGALPDVARYHVRLTGLRDVAGTALAGDTDRWLTSLAGDANRDRAVDVADLGILSTHYGREAGVDYAKGDFNGDGRVDVADLGILATNYGKAVPPPPPALAAAGAGAGPTAVTAAPAPAPLPAVATPPKSGGGGATVATSPTPAAEPQPAGPGSKPTMAPAAAPRPVPAAKPKPAPRPVVVQPTPSPKPTAAGKPTPIPKAASAPKPVVPAKPAQVPHAKPPVAKPAAAATTPKPEVTAAPTTVASRRPATARTAQVSKLVKDAAPAEADRNRKGTPRSLLGKLLGRRGAGRSGRP